MMQLQNQRRTDRAKLDLGFEDDEMYMLISVYTRSGGMQDASTAFVTLGPQGNTYILPFVIPPF